ncbi:MAG: hypothetical protein QXJ72_05605 [Thermoproteota archaeon]
MSWETLLVLHINFMPDVPTSIRRNIVQKVKEELELSPSEFEAYNEKINDEYDDASFIHVNWMSHVDEELIEKVFGEIKQYLRDFSVSLYYLSESDYGLVWDGEEEVMTVD